ncbi:ankyrin repeat protein, putative [Bodo saltans]|uniref:Ankyrin repeat protein, putative n=1 Tax=Bodo saltans TaxID=75058 RepID=A0A0S4J2H2_BODSA|nr:ankyrin repeat protein, putative [Bodo saltans]|eukprot:CUG84737.1 ankyrin repeat protein, putative [Bodo saltans]
MSTNESQAKPLSIYDACRKRDVERVTKYISEGGCVTEFDENKMTMLHHAAFSGSEEIVRLIMSTQPKQKLDLDASDVGGWAPLHYASDQGHAAIVLILVDDGANVNARDDMKKTPLHLAAGQGHVSVVQVLLKHGASRGAKTVTMWDALKYAEENKHDEVVKLLAKKE